jgi:hypothetical protein
MPIYFNESLWRWGQGEPKVTQRLAVFTLSLPGLVEEVGPLRAAA